MDWLDVEEKLKGRIVEVAQHLLPAGKREGGEWICGNLNGQPGRSLKVNVTGKPGVWCDFADGGKGGKTVMSLWCSVRACEFKFAIKEAKDFLGIKDGFQNPTARPFAPVEEKPQDSAWRKVEETWAKCEPVTETGPVWKYLVETRKFDPGALSAYDVREMVSHGCWVMVFPYYAAPVEEKPLVQQEIPSWLKFEALDRPAGKKKEWTSQGPEKSLFGVQLARHPAFRACRNLLIAEGEKDAIAWASYGCATWNILPVSVPFGAKWKGSDANRPSPNREWLDRNWDFVQSFESVFVAMDNDNPGRRAAGDIIAEIGPRRCRMVQWEKEAG